MLEHADLPPIKDAHRRSITAQMLENTQRELRVDVVAPNEALGDRRNTKQLPYILRG